MEEVKKKNEKENSEEASSNGGKVKKNSSVDSGNEASSEDSNDSTTRSNLPTNENSNSGMFKIKTVKESRKILNFHFDLQLVPTVLISQKV